MAQNKIANLLLVSGSVALLFYLLNFGVTSNSPWVLLAIVGGYYAPIAILVGLAMKILDVIERFRR